jgi:hypothetical protein
MFMPLFLISTEVVMPQEVVVVFTARRLERILAEGGTSAWRLAPKHARQCKYAICTRNAHGHWDQGDWGNGPEAHHEAFLIGKIKKVIPIAAPPENDESQKNRYLIQFSEFARVNIPDFWSEDRNPVNYMRLDDLKIDFSKLKWEPMPESANLSDPAIEAPAPNNTVGTLTMAEAKKGLALTFNVTPEAIEITIRG